MYANSCSLFCFTETHIADRPFRHINEFEVGWIDIHKRTEHGLAICYNASKVSIIEEIQTSNALEILPVLIEIENERVLLVLVYRKPGPLGNFIYELVEQVTELPTENRVLIVGDFNLDQMLPENIEKLNPIIEHFNLNQRSQYSTHIFGGILDIVLDNNNSDPVYWIPSPYSDHFLLLIEI